MKLRFDVGGRGISVVAGALTGNIDNNDTINAGTGIAVDNAVTMTGTITNAVAFNNTGTLTLGHPGGTQTYTGGLTATDPSAVSIAGRAKAAQAI